MVYLQGEEVLRCLPYSHIVLQEVQNLVCDFCLRFKPNNNDCSYQRCSRCKLVYYCSVSCQKKGLFNHNYSISFFQKRKIWYICSVLVKDIFQVHLESKLKIPFTVNWFFYFSSLVFVSSNGMQTSSKKHSQKDISFNFFGYA